ncbi:MAG: PQQ-dependent dehydrogenase, methanol/ethanol family [Deltaproteobacteria bacterium]|jgi:PQQ-dependent dehydrogenase (methanol/ethanol family)|nr:PQQ-dependent dehydrogenase, methanol/ethanol family [Deltaproteobacteria bacterium]
MDPRRAAGALAIGLLLIGSGCDGGAGQDPAGAREASPAIGATHSTTIDAARLAAPEPGSWLTHGRTYAEQRYSPLTQIKASNVSELGLAWSFDLQSERGVESTPLVADGTLYVTAPWSILHALDAKSGELLWTYDPGVPRSYARNICCGVVNRGAALHGDHVFVGTLDGRLVAVDRESGREVWSTMTGEPEWPYSITGAPRVVEGLVVIGNAGADLGARGYVSAYDAETGELVWRTYTVPGDPAKGFESPAMERAAETWTGQWWKAGGGGTVWDALAYDPELHLLYVGTGNGTPHARWLRSPDGGDNLYLSSILALRPETGELVWHYQETPAESWDYTATQHILLADIEIAGRLRKVLLHAPKNGFFFVIDRETGEFISAEPFTEVNWASHYDETGRPVENDTDYREDIRFVRPSPYGAHSWPPMSFHPKTGLVYLPVRNMGSLYLMNKNWEYRPGEWNTGLNMEIFEKFGSSEAEENWEAFLLAWDPIARREVWRVPHITASNGGTLATGNDLLFEGSADGRFVAYRASTGEKLWESPVGTGVMAGPISYEVDGEQYVAVAAGWGASFALSGGEAALLADVRGGGRVLAWKLGGKAEVPPGRPPLGPVPTPTYEVSSTAAERREGMLVYHAKCSPCHGPGAIGGGSGVPDLRYTTPETHAIFSDIVLAGLREAGGMPRFDDLLDAADVRRLQAWILEQARIGSQRTP